MADLTASPETPRTRAFLLLERAGRRGLAARVFDAALVALILGNVAATVVATIPGLPAETARLLLVFDRLCVLVFALEYAARLWTAPEQPLFSGLTAAEARLRLAMAPMMIVDALALVPFLEELVFPDNPQVILLRLVRFLKVARYSTALPTIGRVVADIRRQILACIILFACLIILSAGVMTALEGRGQPEHFGSLPHSLWWAMVMLTKVGQTDATPLTVAGKCFAVVMLLFGIGFMALPVGIIGRAFYDEIRRRDFVITFTMVARVPLFRDLDPAAIAGLVGLLRSRKLPPGSVVMRRGDAADAMYFITEGRVDVSFDGATVNRLGPGDFFGEMALVTPGPRTATVTAMAPTDVLVLDAGDFARLMQSRPELEAVVRRTAAARRRDLPAAEAAND